MKARILRRWTEVQPTMFTDKKDDRVEHILVIDRCEKKKSAKTGKVTVDKRRDAISFAGPTLDAADRMVAEFVGQKGVVLLDEAA